ncbi:MAG: Rrf2 family transcriptional regulator [Candidatus Omnitrophica bacterium]|nr:Rrf2 family transcriptional regulator [Candidatus Omnitrophota bacterium]MBI2174421.1 Rrf2 family transcriptional regulator [Candidatus Omnitrophota bacterium]MBI3010546.1 Rrf2 family transcriptional regulator [Candidatus Omnitrophota bacterium]
MLSKKSKYAIRALLALAKRQEQAPMLIAELADREEIPKKFLEIILLELKNKGVLQSKKGKGGGYLLGRNPEDITLGEVIRALDGPLAPLPCVSQTAYQKCDECQDENTCGLRAVMKEVRDATAQVLDRESLADMLRRHELLQQKQNKVPVYAI